MNIDQSEWDAYKKRLRILEDKEEIRDVLAKYAFNVDFKRLDKLMELWTDDCVFITDIAGETVHNKGKEAIRKFITSLPGLQCEHLQLDYIIDIDGDEAIATGYQLIPIAMQNGGFSILRCSVRTFKFRNVKGKWLIKETVSHSITDVNECLKLLPAS
jgi:ketosteroid isomerase-like protein